MRFVAVTAGILVVIISSVSGSVFPPLELADRSPSARAHGLAESGVSIADFGFQSINPATIGLVGLEQRGVLTFTPVYSRPLQDWDVRDKGYSQLHGGAMGSMVLSRNETSPQSVVSVAYSVSRMKMPIYSYAWWYSGYTRSVVHDLSVAYGRRGAVDYAVGGSVNFLNFDDYLGLGDNRVGGGSGVCFDIGAIARFNKLRLTDGLRLTPSAGISLKSFGPHIDYRLYHPSGDVESLGLDRQLKAGVSMALVQQHSDIIVPTLLVSADYEHHFNDYNMTTRVFHYDDNYYRLGAEFGLAEIMMVRVGSLVQNNSEPLSSWGISAVPSVWFRSLLDRNRSNTGNPSWLRQVDVAVEYSKSGDSPSFYYDNERYLDITLLWRW